MRLSRLVACIATLIPPSRKETKVGILDGLCDIKGPSNAASIGGNGAFSSHTCDIGNIQSLFRPLLTSERLTGT